MGSQIKGRFNSRLAKAQAHVRGHFFENLMTEWNLFWGGIRPEIIETDEFDRSEVQGLDLNRIKALTKTLSDERKKINRHLESIKKEIDLNTAKLDSLKLVGADTADTTQRIVELNDLGEQLSAQLSKLDQRLNIAREYSHRTLHTR